MLRKLFFITCLVVAANAIAQNTASKSSKTTKDTAIDYKQVGAPMPSLVIIPFVDSLNKLKKQKEFITGKDLDNDANLFVMMFNPTCSHCQEQTKLFEEHISLFKKTKLVLIANKIMKPYLNDFITFTNIDKYPDIYLGIDSTDFISNVFLYQSLPQINIYSSDRKLIKTYTGDVPIDTLKKYIQ